MHPNTHFTQIRKLGTTPNTSSTQHPQGDFSLSQTKEPKPHIISSCSSTQKTSDNHLNTRQRHTTQIK